MTSRPVSRIRWILRRAKYVSVGEAIWRAQLFARQALVAFAGVRLHWAPSGRPDLSRCAALDNALGVEARARMGGSLVFAAQQAGSGARLNQYGPSVDYSSMTSVEDVSFDVSGLSGRFGPGINWRGDGFGDIREFWERCRLQWLVKELFESDAPEQVLEKRLTDFLQSHPPLRGAAWISGLEGASRAVSGILAAGVAMRRGGLTARGEVLLGELLSGCWDLCILTASAGSSRNNHALGERVAEAAIAWICCADEKRVTSLIRRAANEVSEQTNRDGSGREVAPAYWSYNLEWAILLLALAREARVEIGDDVTARIDASVAVLETVNRAVPKLILGDTDEATVWSRFWRPLDAGDDARMTSAHVGESCVVLEAGLGVVHRPQSGFHFSMRAGSFGYPAMAPHSHADQLALYCEVKGVPLVVDSGSHRYFGVTRRELFRLEESHATFVVEGLRQAIPEGRFLWSGMRDGVIKASGKCIEASLSWPGVELSRHLLWADGSSGRLDVTDRVQGFVGGAVHWYWPLGEAIIPKLRSNVSCDLKGPDFTVRLKVEGQMQPNDALRLEPIEISCGYADVRPSNRIVFSSAAVRELRWSFELIEALT